MKSSFWAVAGSFLIFAGRGEALIGRAVKLDGHGAFVECQVPPLASPSGRISLSAWILTEDPDAEVQTVFSMGVGTKENISLRLLAGGIPQLRVPTILDSTETVLLATSDSLRLEAGVWCHVAAVFAPDQEWAGIYLNGRLAARLDSEIAPVGPQLWALFWGGAPKGAYLSGMVDEISIWDSALSQEEIQGLLGGALTGKELSLAAYFPIDAADQLGHLEDKIQKEQLGFLHGSARFWETQLLVPPGNRGIEAAANASPAPVDQADDSEGQIAEKPDLAQRYFYTSTDEFADWDKKWHAPPPQGWELEEDDIWLRYNRVEGAFVGWKLPRKYTHQQGMSHFGQVGYGFSNKAWRYRAGSEIYTFYPDLLGTKSFWSLGAEFYDKTASEDGWLVSEEENSLDAILVRRDFRDYFRRSGWSIYTLHNLSGLLQVGVKVQQDEFASMENEVDWIVRGNRFARKEFRPNPGVDENKINSWRADIQLDNRDRPHLPGNGWLVNGFYERGGGILAGDREYSRYLLDLRRHHKVGWDTRVDLRVRAGGSSGDLPTQFFYDLGGFSSLRGYPFKAFSGQRLLLANLEYWIDSDHWGGDWPLEDINLGVFYDVGAAWLSNKHPSAGENPELAEANFKRSFGFGLNVPSLSDSFRLFLARTLDQEKDDWSLAARFSRSF